MPLRRLLAALLLATPLTLHAQSAVSADPAPDKANLATMQSFQLPSHGYLLNAFLYIAAGVGPHPTVVLLHGFPGNERNLDLAQAMRRAGYNVLYFNYRGSWGSPGNFSFTHAIEDAQAAIGFLREPATAEKLRVDPRQIIVAGHSMGGMITAYVAAHDPTIEAAILISAADMAGRTLPAVTAHQEQAALPKIAAALAGEGLAPLTGCTPESLATELMANASRWSLPEQASGLSPHPVLILTSDDGGAAPADALAANLRKAGDTHVTAIHISTDHAYSDHRIALEQAVLRFLAQMPASK